MSPPTISVVVPAFNEAAWIAEALEAVLAQTSPADEIIVVDDGSTDDTAAEVRRFDDRVRLVRQENRGCPAAFNRGFGEAAGEYVALCPADDLWEPAKLEWQRGALAAHPEVDVVFGAARNFGLDESDFPAPPRSGLQDRREFARAMYLRDVIADPSAVVRRSLHARLGGYREDMIGEDYDFWMRALRAGAVFYYDPRLVVRLRQHGGNLSARALEMWRVNHAIHVQFADFADDAALVERVLARDLLHIGRCALGLGRIEAARDAYAHALRHRFSLYALLAASALRLPGARWLLARALRVRRRQRATE